MQISNSKTIVAAVLQQQNNGAGVAAAAVLQQQVLPQQCWLQQQLLLQPVGFTASLGVRTLHYAEEGAKEVILFAPPSMQYYHSFVLFDVKQGNIIYTYIYIYIYICIYLFLEYRYCSCFVIDYKGM